MKTALLATLALAAAPAPAPALAQDSVVGSGTATTGTLSFDFAFDAASGPAGESPGGTATFGSSTGVVTCLSVAGNTAVVGVDNEVIPHFPVDSLYVLVDGGPAGAGDTITTYFLQAPPTPSTCSPPSGTPPPPFAVTSGDIAIHDAPPLPTSKEDCKNGGWRQFGFKNQGRCVASTHP